MKPFIQDGHTLALRAVRKLVAASCAADTASGAGEPRLVIECIETIDWASVTFVGKRHMLDLRLEGAGEAVTRAVERLAADLPEVDVEGAGWFLADAGLDNFEVVLDHSVAVARIRVAALTIEE